MKIIVRALAGASYALLVTVAVSWSSIVHAAPPGDSASSIEEQTSREGAVTVKVAPRGLAPGAQSWDFAVTLETHTQPLTQDMVSAATLLDAAGNVHVPLGWEGYPPGGHHRKGVLRFQPPVNPSGLIELHISGVGGVSERVFRWRIAE
jgi:hypothetical protein